jgi:hypothetical protein
MYIASLTGVEIASRVPVINADAIAQRRERRRQMGLEFDEAADRRRRALANGEPNPLKPFRRAAAFQMLHADDDAVAALARFADFDETGKRHAGHWILQHRVGDARGLQGRDRNACGDRGKAERDCKSRCAPARQECDDDAGERRA